LSRDDVLVRDEAARVEVRGKHLIGENKMLTNEEAAVTMIRDMFFEVFPRLALP
jgi:hypothetical protein